MLRFHELEELGVTAAISDISDGDCGRRSPDQEAAANARHVVCTRLGLMDQAMVCGEQVHGTNIAVATETDLGVIYPATDGILTAAKGLPVAIFVADCVPVFVYDECAGVAGVLHAGREGTRLNICATALEVMRKEFETSSEHVHAVIGPSAGPCCYEVSVEIAHDWARHGLPVRNRNLDLWQANAVQLANAGVPPQNIHITGLCTVCGGRFHSYRNNAKIARNMAIMAL